MKAIILHLFLISIFGFSYNSRYVKMESVTNLFGENQTILTTGEWRLCEEINNRCVLQYNQCSKLIFNSNNTGVFIKPSSKRLAFKWELLNEDSLNIVVIDRGKENESIKEGMYQIIFTNKANYIELKLKYVDSDLIYILRK